MIIIKLKDRYFIWGERVQAPTSWDIREEELLSTLRSRLRDTKLAVEAVVKVKAVLDGGRAFGSLLSIDEIIEGNKAGPNGKCLTADEIYTAYTRPVYIYAPEFCKPRYPKHIGRKGRILSDGPNRRFVNFRMDDGTTLWDVVREHLVPVK